MMKMIGTSLKIMTAVALCTVFYAAGVASSAGEAGAAEGRPYEVKEALKTLINPHEQINDEGEVLWGRCLICHRNVPDPNKERSIKDVKLRYKEEIKDLCFRCHPVKIHPGSEGISPAMSGFVAPDHLVVPPRDKALNMRLSKKEVYTNIPLDPANGKITCATCHNPHERGVLSGRADWGADSSMRLRTEGLDICQYCHRK
jgi:hypothetical protein